MVVGLEQHLGVAVREEPVTEVVQFLPQLFVVVYTAVPTHGQAELRIDHRLRAGLGEIDDFQATVAQRDPTL